MPFIDIVGPIVANTAYVGGTLVAKDVEATLPEVTPTMTDVEAMGTMSLPVWQRLENMEFSISKVGVDLGLRAMLKPEPLSLELRFVQDKTDANSKTTALGCKAFIKGIPAGIPGISATPGENSINEVTYTATRYQLFVNGSEMFLIDRLAGIVRINGTDYTQAINSLL